ncbi:MAG: phage holin family protein [Chitinophagaceae bacterium]|nr:phage holin family protein [Chitinophagaceae bacterium]
MIRFIGKTLITAVAVLVAAYVVTGVHVRDSMTAVLIAAVLGLLNSFVKPILVIITIPITIFTLGLFLLVINIIIVKWVSEIVPGFSVDGWVAALLFSFVVSIATYLLESIIGTDKNNS